jgi:hypothetical protein
MEIAAIISYIVPRLVVKTQCMNIPTFAQFKINTTLTLGGWQWRQMEAAIMFAKSQLSANLRFLNPIQTLNLPQPGKCVSRTRPRHKKTPEQGLFPA